MVGHHVHQEVVSLGHLQVGAAVSTVVGLVSVPGLFKICILQCFFLLQVQVYSPHLEYLLVGQDGVALGDFRLLDSVDIGCDAVGFEYRLDVVFIKL